MKRVTIAISSDVDLKFRKKASQKYQFEKGWYSSAVADAMKDWAEDTIEKNHTTREILDYINPEFLKKLKMDLNLENKSIENVINQFGPEKEYQLNITRENDNIIIKLGHENDSDLEKNLKSILTLYFILDMLISSLEETTDTKYEIEGIGKIPPIYLKKVG
ncbi:hypothetical protein [Methanobacterium alcaliphilum]|uniref:hypothetical protein n=1 Tax=Methanobacterium alcaliphilum TaxID=392018 RepID=UPI00200B37DA|nr:hypothetical protein [Methanobacterium alcaliphilum]MCK9152546.1 hypothetical protein [Methanobacterium alcaliphilum]